jgi:kanamycin kinase
MIARRPEGDVVVPAPVARVAAEEAVRVVWENELGGLTFQLGEGPGRRFVKWAPAGSGIDLGAEADRLRWAAAYTTVPRVLDVGSDRSGHWLVTQGLPGESAVGDRWLKAPAGAVAAIGAGLRVLHDALPVAECPFSWSVEDQLADVERRASAGAIDLRGWHSEDHGLDGVEEALSVLATPPPVDRLVVCHGDACAPNTLVDEDGRWTGHVDLGSLGVSDRWADLAVATWSTQWNYGPGWEETLLEAYGVASDAVRTRYYRLLWDLGP